MTDAADGEPALAPEQSPFPALNAAVARPASERAAPPQDAGHILRTDLLGEAVVPGRVAGAAELQDLATRAAEYASRAHGDGTRRVYRSAWRGFEAWCHSLRREPLSGDPQLLAMYATRRTNQGVSVRTLRAVRCARFNRDSSAGNVGLLKPPTRVKPAPTIR
jgi:hypothetical protein